MTTTDSIMTSWWSVLISLAVCFSPMILNAASARPTCNFDRQTFVYSEDGTFPQTLVTLSSECSTTNPPLVFNLEGGTNILTHFDLDPTTTELVLKASPAPDAEETLSGIYTSAFYLLIKVEDSAPTPLQTFVNIVVRITSTNDNTPTFSAISTFGALPQTITVPETQTVGSTVFQCSIQDDDNVETGARQAITRAQISSGNIDDTFALDPYTCKVILIEPLDYTTTTSYSLAVQAYDLGAPSATNTQTLTVSVSKSDISPPVCAKSVIVAQVNDGDAPNTAVGSLACTDREATTLTYTVSELADRFDVSAAGAVTLKTAVDTESADVSLEGKITVSDNGTPEQSTTVTVCVYVKDIDDNTPSFTGEPYEPDVRDDALVGQLVDTVSATDPDTDPVPTRITFALQGGKCPQDWFVINPDGGQLLTKSKLDAATASTVECIVEANSEENADPAVTATVKITIEAYNKDPPAFTQADPPLYSVVTAIPENTPPSGTAIITVAATDPDASTITYSMAPGTPFNVNPSTGVITQIGALDYETAQYYLLRVVARDAGSPILSATTFVYIPIGEVNEFTPLITPINDVSVPELAVPGFVFVTATATDNDAGLDGSIEYSLQDENVPFVMDAVSGEISVAFALDYDVATEYTVVVLANDLSATTANRKTGTATFTLSIIDDDDSAPTCNIIGDIVITPDKNVGDIIANPKLSCTDGDTGNAPTYQKVSGDPNNYFAVNPTTGDITLATAPMEGIYTVLIDVKDGGGQAGLTTRMPVVIKVETQLEFTALLATISVPEDTAIGTTLYTVVASGSYSGLTYSLVNCVACKFFINPSTGVLRLFGALDRETQDTYSLTVRVQSINGKSLDQGVEIIVTDINDNPPVFPSSYFSFSLSETLTPPHTVDTIVATDADIDDNKVITYGIASGNEDNKFTYDPNTGELKMVGALDYETVQSYTLVLTATDAGTPALSASTTVFIIVVNVDEHQPEIIPPGGTITKSVAENAAIGGVLFRITATDNDLTDYLSYRITTGNSASKFFIDPDNGDFYLVSALDRETTDSYSLTVLVQNQLAQTVTTTVDITVTDINDNSPLFAPGNYVFVTPDSTPADTSIGRLTVTDADLTPNSDVTLTIVSGDTGSLFKFNGLALESAAPLTTVANPYVLEVQAADGGNPSLSATATVSVIVEPAFAQPGFLDSTKTVAFLENVALGTLIDDFDATVNGATEGPTGDLRYSIRTGDSTTFYMEPYTGQLVLQTPFDYDVTTSYSLVISAANRNAPTLSATTSLTVSVTQVNLDTPSFVSQMYTFTISEATTANTNIGTPIQAVDTDPGLYGTVSYTIETNSAIAVNPTTGQLRTTSALDYSIAKSYYLKVYATDDAGASSKTGTSVVIISITDTNNHNPTFPNSPYTLDAPETLLVGEPLGIIKAEDLDSGMFGTVTYSIISGDIQNKFTIGSSTGILTVNEQLDYENTTQYVLTVQAADGGTPSLSGTATVSINVIDENDNAPVFSTTRIELVIPTTFSTGGTVHTVTATDQDTGLPGQVSYIIEDGNADQYFNIDLATGVITTAKILSTTGGYYVLAVIAVDKGTPPLTGTTTVAIAVQDQTNAPSGDYDFTVTENEPAGTVVGTIPKVDASLIITGYTFTGGNYGGNFAVRLNADQSATVTTVRSLDREEYAVYQLALLITHATGTLEKRVKVSVLDVNDNPPVITPAIQSLTMVEMTPVGTSIGQVTVTDADETGANTLYTLDVRGRYQNLLFQVDTATGVISPRTLINFEADRREMPFRVVAYDNASPQHVVSASVTVTIIDFPEVENLLPMEPGYFMSQVIPFDLAGGSKAYTLSVADFGLTSSAGDTVVYASSSETGTVFTVDPSTGTMVVNENALVYPYNSRVVQWVTCAVTSGGVTTARVGVVRFDLFSKNLHMISVVSTESQADFEAQRATLQSELDAKFTAPQAPRIFTIAEASIQEPPSTGSAAHVVGIKDSTIETIDKINELQSFLTHEEMLTATQASPDGTPAAGLSSGGIKTVAPYDDGTRTDDTTIDDPAIIAAIVVGTVAGVFLIVAIFAVVAYACYTTRTSPTVHSGNPNPPPSEKPVNNPRTRQPEISNIRPAYKGNPPPKPPAAQTDPVIFHSDIFGLEEGGPAFRSRAH